MSRLGTSLAVAIAASAFLAACGTPAENTANAGNEAAANEAVANEAAPAGGAATTALSSATGVASGTATIEPSADGLKLTVNAEALPPGTHGIHVHMVGKCEGPGFETAGAHWNPTTRQHGLENPQGSHAGDLPNLVVGADGRGTLTANLAGATMTGEGGLLDADGAALVVHADPDDLKTDPSGNSGGRIACGVFAAS